MKTKKHEPLVTVAILAMLSAVSFVLYLFEFPIIPGASHLKLDLSDIPAVMAGLICGPVGVIAVELIKNLLELFVRGIGSQMGFGNIMNFLVGCAYCIPFSLAYRAFEKKGKLKKTVSVIIADMIGIFAIIAVGIVGNYFIDPPFFKFYLGIELTSETLWPAIWSATAINAIKGVMLSIVNFPIVLALLDRIRKIGKK